MDFIILIFLTIRIGRLAQKKGLSSWRWRMHLVVAWMGAELMGAIIGVLIFGADNLISSLLLALGCALTAYLLLNDHLQKLPDVLSDEDVDKFGS